MPIPVPQQEIADLLQADRLRHPAIYETFSQPVTQPYGNMLQRIQQTRERSMYWANQDRFAEALIELKKAAGLPNGWDSYGAEAPAPASVSIAGHILSILQHSNVPPSRVAASAEGGVGICFVEGEKYADIEVFNDEEILATTYRGDSGSSIWELENRDASIIEAVEQIRAHLSA
jgi:hypothetical protein